MNRFLVLLSFCLFITPLITEAQTLTPQDIIQTNDTSFCPPQSIQLVSDVQGCTYVTETFPYAPEPIGGTLLGFGDDQVQGPFNIGFSFDYFCNTYTQFYICSNGWVGFTGGQTATWVVQTIPSAAFNRPRNCIMGPWRDWMPSAGVGPYISYQTVGTAPNRKLIVTWDGVPLFACTSTLGTFQIVLNETSNIIDNHLTNVPTCLTWGNGDGTQGVHNLAGTVGIVAAGRNDNQFTAVNESWRYLPPTVAWIYNDDTVGTAATLDIEPNGVYPLECEYVYAVLDSGNGGVSIDSVLISRTCDVPIMSSIDVLCNGDSTGTAVFQDTSDYGQQNQLYWNVIWTDINGDTIRAIQSLDSVDSLLNVPAGTYFVEFFDGEGCNRQTGQVTVDEPTILGASILNETPVSCPGTTLCDASADGDASGGVGPYSYVWSTGELTQTASMLCAGLNYLTVTDANGCDSVVSVDIDVPAPIVTDAAGDTLICITNPAAIIATSSGGTAPYSYVWIDDTINGDTASLSANDLVFPEVTTTYYVSSTDANNCPGDTAKVLVKVRPALFDTISQVDTICPYDTIDLTATGFGGDSIYTYTWSAGSFGSTVAVSPDTSTWYFVTISDQCGTPSIVDSTFVQVGGYSPIRATIRAEDDSICVGENIYLIATGAGGFRGPDEFEFQWNINSWTDNPYQFATPKKTTQYLVTITDLCLSPAGYDTLTVSVGNPVKPVFSATPSISCKDEEVIIALANFNEKYEYDWTLGDGTFVFNAQTDSLFHQYSDPGCYDVHLKTTTQFGCVSEKTMPCLVNILTSPTAGFVNIPANPSTMDPMVEFYDESINAESIQWSIEGKDFGMESYFQHEFIDSGLYTVRLIATSDDGCQDTITKSLRNRVLQTIYIPKSFTPNGDGVNDFFKIEGEEIGQQGFELVIFDRWGNEVFKSTNPKRAWDGSIQGVGMAPIGTYPYTLRYIDRYKEKQLITGNLVISKSSSTGNSTNN